MNRTLINIGSPLLFTGPPFHMSGCLFSCSIMEEQLEREEMQVRTDHDFILR